MNGKQMNVLTSRCLESDDLMRVFVKKGGVLHSQDNQILLKTSGLVRFKKQVPDADSEIKKYYPNSKEEKLIPGQLQLDFLMGDDRAERALLMQFLHERAPFFFPLYRLLTDN